MVALHYIYITRFTSILDTFYNILQCYTQTHYTYTYLLEPQTHYTVTLQGVLCGNLAGVQWCSVWCVAHAQCGAGLMS